MFKKIKLFLTDVNGEFRKVTWSKKEQIIKQTGVVLVMVAMMAVFLGGVDWILSITIKQILQ